MPQFDPPEELLAEVAARFRVTVGPTFVHAGSQAWVARARRGDTACVLKIFPMHDEARDEAAGLRAWDGAGVVRLLDELADGPTTALLLEECVPGTPLADADPAEQDVVLADLLPRLWIPAPAGPFRPLADMCAWWADEAAGKGVPPEFHDGLELFRTLPLEASEHVLLATDLHAGNVLAARREPWLAIDPKPYVGDPTYDALQHLLNHPDRLVADPVAFVARMAGLLGLDRDRLQEWLYARCVQESPGDPYLLDVARRLRH